MQFNSYSFLLFFVLVIAVARVLTNWTGRKFFLLMVSYVFYAAWNPPFVVLLWISTVVDWVMARAIHRTTSETRRKGLLLVSLAANFGMLGYFKYGAFLQENFVVLMHALGVAYEPARLSIILPVGISFYTFQTLSYVFDVYRRRMAPCPSFLDYALYVTFFPQLVAGPIVRAMDFLPQCVEPRQATGRQFLWGIYLLVIGLFNKVVVSDNLMAKVTEAVYDRVGAVGWVEAWAGTLAFSVQIFCDFAGYSSCAIGAALCLGFALTDNFRFPYGAIGFSDFWRRWHISLSTWLRDYLYITMGGNRKGTRRTTTNLMATMLIGGLWHGASWLFVIWGGLHGLYLVAERWVTRLPVSRWKVWGQRTGRVALVLLTHGLVCVAWVFFRSHSLKQAMEILGSMAGGRGWAVGAVLLPAQVGLVGLVAAGTLLLHYRLRDSSMEEWLGGMPWWMRAGLIAGLACLVVLGFHGEDRAFIYFQF